MELNAAYYQGQFTAVRQLVQRTWEGIPDERWHEMPAGLDTNLAWQVGHLVISQYFAPVVVLFDSQAEVKQRLSIKEYATLFGLGSDPKHSTQYSKSITELKADLDYMQELTLRLLADYDFSQLAEPPLRPHPVGKTQGRCLDWGLEHEMWHGGQLAMLRKALGYPTLFGNG